VGICRLGECPARPPAWPHRGRIPRVNARQPHQAAPQCRT
jgi:hypothetical protein